MLEVIYRIYEVADEKTAVKNREKDLGFGLFSSTSNPEKSLNIMCTANLKPEQLQFEEVKE